MQATLTQLAWGRPRRLPDSGAGLVRTSLRGPNHRAARGPARMLPAAHYPRRTPSHPPTTRTRLLPLLPSQHIPSRDPTRMHYIIITMGQRPVFSPSAARVVARRPSHPDIAPLPSLPFPFFRAEPPRQWWARSIALTTPRGSKCPAELLPATCLHCCLGPPVYRHAYLAAVA